MVAQAGTADARNFRLRRRTLEPRRLLIGAQARERRARDFGISRRHLPYQFEKQWKRARSAFMLRCTLLR
jgi:hypothetical protein